MRENRENRRRMARSLPDTDRDPIDRALFVVGIAIAAMALVTFVWRWMLG